MSKLDQIFKVMEKAAIAIQIGGRFLPVVSGVVSFIREVRRADGTIEYHLVLEQGGENIAKSRNAAVETISLVNKELAKQGKPALEIPTEASET